MAGREIDFGSVLLQEIDTFVKEFLSVVQRLPSCISTLHALSRLPLPTTFSELQHFCSTNEAKFQHLRRSGPAPITVEYLEMLCAQSIF